MDIQYLIWISIWISYGYLYGYPFLFYSKITDILDIMDIHRDIYRDNHTYFWISFWISFPHLDIQFELWISRPISISKLWISTLDIQCYPYWFWVFFWISSPTFWIFNLNPGYPTQYPFQFVDIHSDFLFGYSWCWPVAAVRPPRLLCIATYQPPFLGS